MLFAAACNAVLPLRSVWRTSAPCRSSSRNTASSRSSQARWSGLLCRFPLEKLTSRSRCLWRYDFSLSRSPSFTYSQTRFWPRDNMWTGNRWSASILRSQISLLCISPSLTVYLGPSLKQVRRKHSLGSNVPGADCFRLSRQVSVLDTFQRSFYYVTQQCDCTWSFLSFKASRHLINGK